MKTLQFAARTINLVNAPEAEVMQSFLSIANGQEKVSSLEEVGRGACGAVYKLAEGYALKVNGDNDWAQCEDGRILADLQGVPMIPTLYAYSQDNKYMLMQLIDGVTVGSLWNKKDRVSKQFDIQEAFQRITDFHKESLSRGWVGHDLHSYNVMIDVDSKLWIVDVGLFQEKQEGAYINVSTLLSHVEEVADELLKVRIDYEEIVKWDGVLKAIQGTPQNKSIFFNGSTSEPFTTPSHLSTVSPIIQDRSLTVHPVAAAAIENWDAKGFQRLIEDCFKLEREPEELILSVKWQPQPRLGTALRGFLAAEKKVEPP